MPDHDPRPAPAQVRLHEIAHAILAQVPHCTDQCHAAIQSFVAARSQLRAQFSHRIAPVTVATAQPLCAIDGTHDLAETSGLTIVLLVAVAVAGTTPIAQRTRVLLLPPLDEADLLAGDLRTRLELGVLAEVLRREPDTCALLDGSLVSIYLTLRRLLRRHLADQQAGRPDWWSAISDLLDRATLAADWQCVLESDRVLAHPKRVTTRHEVPAVTHLLPTALQSDVLLWSTVLQPGEYTLPTPLLSFPARVPETFWGMSRAERNTITAAHRRWRTVYVRLRPTDPALRLEVPDQSTTMLQTTFATLRSTMQVSEIREPLPQYLADAVCTGQRQVLQALITGMHNGLRREWDSALVDLWMGGWRTR